MILGGIEVNLFGQFILLNSLNIRRKIWRRTITFNSTFLPKLVLLNSIDDMSQMPCIKQREVL